MLLLDAEATLNVTRSDRLINALDRSLGLCLAIASAPLVIGSATAVMVLSRRSPFIAHLRVGQHGAALWVLKLRTMWDRESTARGPFAWVEKIVAEPAPHSKKRDDPRVRSRFAAFCRRYSIDELPQLWQVVRGNMSLVGPRPLTRSEIDSHYGPRKAELLSVRPGLTGLWQVQGRSAIQFPARASMDIRLAQDRSLRTYLKTLVRTIPAVLGGNGAW
jgi:exopolysaccharide production protein ExoY